MMYETCERCGCKYTTKEIESKIRWRDNSIEGVCGACLDEIDEDAYWNNPDMDATEADLY